MSDVLIEHNEPAAGRKRNRRLTIVATVVIIIVVLLELLSTEQQTTRTLKPGELITKPGVYRCGSRVVVVSGPRDGFVAIRKKWRQKKLFLIDGTWDHWPDQVRYVEGDRDWFVCVDDLDRVWEYVGPTNRDLRERRKSLGGGFGQRVPSAVFFGYYVMKSNQVAHGGKAVSGKGEWAGVPEEFFARIPNKYEPVWGDIPPIPRSPPPLSPFKETLLAHRLKLLRDKLGLE